MTLRVSERLRLTKQFLGLRRRGRWVHGQTLSLGMLPNRLPGTRLGLRTHRGIKGAVVRNRAKRIFRAIYRRHKPRLSGGYDLLVVLRGAGEAAHRDYEAAFLVAVKQLGILTPTHPHDQDNIHLAR